ncbi:protein-glutamate methyltransferase [Methylobacterium sp. BTF04]|uniref:CheR family methyltransferase n=1 Tax=Methylobacterium sp. BTF04 TaxID=2708300 RepID=UPI0013D33112|nr:protein-glutamate O-methyltransferase CheR [Methylobacterium sp. BTF04]NEU11176.1 protein-glutamate methyltransferase [Methylobacterium sp. BTF04]
MTRPLRRGPETDPGFADLKARVIARTGHHYYSDKDDLLFDRLHKRFKACGLPDCTAYLAHLGGAATGAAEWAALEAEITIGETFFFRYAEQFAALRTTILPGLIAARAAKRTLTIWSAGCSTGAEPYSIAILLHELLGSALPEWRIAITGTDISVEALATARVGTYGRWALRTMPTEERLRYFHVGAALPGPGREGTYTLRPEFHRMVRFEQQNLMGLIDGTAPPQLAGFDLILCRNVLIYFQAEAVLGIVQGLGRRLKPDGWLLIGHAEPNPDFARSLDPVNLPGTVAYRPRSAPEVVLPPAPVPVWAPALPPAAPPIPEPAPIAVHLPDPLPVAQAPDLDLAQIRALADAGETGEAWRRVRAAIGLAPMEAALHYYDGLLAHSLGRAAEAERSLRGALYLDRDFVMAHYQLGLLLIALGRPAEAGRALDNATRLGLALAPDAIVPEGDGLGGRELAESAALARAGLREGATG